MTAIAIIAIFLVGVGAGSIGTILIALRMEDKKTIQLAAAIAQPGYMTVQEWMDKYQPHRS